MRNSLWWKSALLSQHYIVEDEVLPRACQANLQYKQMPPPERLLEEPVVEKEHVAFGLREELQQI